MEAWPTYEDLVRYSARFYGESPSDAWHEEMKARAVADGCVVEYDNTHLDCGLVTVYVCSLRDLTFLRYHLAEVIRYLTEALTPSRNVNPDLPKTQVKIALGKIDWLTHALEDAGQV